MDKDKFKEILHTGACALAEAAYEEIKHTSPLYGEEQKERMQNEIENHAHHMKKKLFSGVEACVAGLGESPKVAAIKEELKKAFSQLDSEEALTKAGQDFLNNITWKEQLALSSDCMKELYRGAKNLFEKQDFQRAEKAFFFLSVIDAKEYAFWVGLGPCKFRTKGI